MTRGCNQSTEREREREREPVGNDCQYLVDLGHMCGGAGSEEDGTEADGDTLVGALIRRLKLNKPAEMSEQEV